MLSRICGKVLHNYAFLKQCQNSQKIVGLNSQSKAWFARKTSTAASGSGGGLKKFGASSTDQNIDEAKQKEKENKVLSKKEQIELLTELSTKDRDLTRDEIKSLVKQDQRDRDMSINIINEASFGEYDKYLESMIEKRIEEGKSANEIVQEMLGIQKQGKIQYRENEDDAKLLEKAREESSQFNIFQMDKSIQKQAKGLEQFYNILEQNKDKVEKLSLTELPTREQYKVDRKLTTEEKIEISTRSAAVGAYVASPFADKKNIPKEMLEMRIFEQGDPDRLTYTQRRDMIVEAQEQAMDRLEDNQLEKVKKKTILAQKLHAAEIDTKEDQRFKDLVEVDSKNTELQVDAPTEKEKRWLKREFSDPKRNTFLIQEKKLERSLKMLGVDQYDIEDSEDYQVLSDIVQEDVFIQKKLSEENAEFQKKLERRKRLQEVRKFEQRLNETEYRSDIDYSDPTQNFKGQKVPKHEQYSDLPDLEKLKELSNKYNEMVVKDSHWEIHKKRSMNSLTSYIKSKLSEERGNIASIMLFKPIQIDKISCNEAMTVIYVFWQMRQDEIDTTSEINKLSLEEQALHKYKNMVQRLHTEKKTENKAEMEKKINIRLNKFGGFFSGMICRDLGFKYGPEIRFSISTRDSKQRELKREISDVIPEIMKKKMMEKYEKGEIGQKIHKGKMAMDVDQAIIDLETKLEERMESDASLIAQAKAQHKKENEDKPKTKEQRKALRNLHNKDEFGKKKKKKRARKSEQFWDSLEAH